jgi:hypothetical protein
MEYLREGVKLLFEQGIAELIKQSYNHFVAPILPNTQAEYNGVQVLAAKLFDRHLPWRNKHNPHYENGIIESLVQNAVPSDRVVIVGGGWGVTAVRSAKLVGPNGKVTVFEGSKSQVAKIKSTIELNDVTNEIEINHAIVGPEIRMYGHIGNADYVSPFELPECEILELDCEGSELDILQNLEIRPRVIIVESHGMYNSSSKNVMDNLKSLDYRVKSVSLAEKSNENFCKENDVRVVTGITGSL